MAKSGARAVNDTHIRRDRNRRRDLAAVTLNPTAHWITAHTIHSEGNQNKCSANVLQSSERDSAGDALAADKAGAVDLRRPKLLTYSPRLPYPQNRIVAH